MVRALDVQSEDCRPNSQHHMTTLCLAHTCNLSSKDMETRGSLRFADFQPSQEYKHSVEREKSGSGRRHLAPFCFLCTHIPPLYKQAYNMHKLIINGFLKSVFLDCLMTKMGNSLDFK